MSKKAFLKRVEARSHPERKKHTQSALEAIFKAQVLAAGNREIMDLLHEAEMHLKMAVEWTEMSYRRTDLRRAAEQKGSTKGVKKRADGADFTKADIQDEILAIYNPNESAEWHRRKLERMNGMPISLRNMQRHLKKIRES